MTRFVEPMLASDGKDLLSEASRDTIAQPKLDGFRAQVHSHNGIVTVYSRSGLDVTSRFPEVARTRNLPDLVLDGELVGDMLALNRRMNGSGNPKVGRVRFYAFDLLRVDDEDMSLVALSGRLACLVGMMGRRTGAIRCVRHTINDPLDLWAKVVYDGGEGIVVKDRRSKYLSGRQPSWRKYKVPSLTASDLQPAR